MRRALLIASLLPSFACGCSDSDARVAAAAIELAPIPAANPEPALEPPSPGDELAAKLASGIDRAAFEADLRFIAAARPPGSSHWQAVQDRCAESLAASGFTISRVSADGAGTSVVGRKLGRDPDAPAIVVGAHYDHIDGCAGADDNASGTAAALALARTLGRQHWTRTLYVACWDEEENGLNGSAHWADQIIAEGRALALYLNFDAIAYADHRPNSQALPPGTELLFPAEAKYLRAREYRGDFIVVLADSDARDPSDRYLAHAARFGLPAVRLEIPGALKNDAMLSELRRSDHASFWKHDIPALFLSDTADYRTDTYHCMGRPDTVETLDLDFAFAVTRAATATLAELL